MGFPVGYTDLFLPELLVQVLMVMDLVRNLIAMFFGILGLDNFSEPEMSSTPEESKSELQSLSAALIREVLPVVKFSEVAERAESCAVCLLEFDGNDEIRRLRNCWHIFHRSCLDRWMDHDQKTCPLCRTPFIPGDMQERFNERLWLAYGGENSQIVAGV
nr:E3 ubiquitin-protein ligase RHA1B-like [Ipomoea trifida]